MELQFAKKDLNCLNRVLWETKNQEQTLEIKLTDSMPDVGKVLCVWGQPILRSKEWRGNGMGITGGIQVWVLYNAEDGSGVRTVEGWIPFQMRWEFPQTQRDGTMRVCCMLQSLDARITSARKLMVRGVVSALAEAMEPVHKEIYAPENIPEDVQLLRKSYPVCLPQEAGERSVTLDEEIRLPAASEGLWKLLTCTAQPELVDQKLLGDKVVFRGAVLVRGLLRGEDGSLKPFSQEIPFSQYGELEKEYGPLAAPDVILAMTDWEAEWVEGGTLRIKGGLTGQYVVFDSPMVEVVEDAYSVDRELQKQTEALTLPAVLEWRQQRVQAEQPLQDAGEVLDTTLLAGHPIQRNLGRERELELTGTFQILTGEPDQGYQTQILRWEQEICEPADEGVQLLCRCSLSGRAYTEDAMARGDLALDLMTVTQTQIPMVTGLSLGEKKQRSTDRPSLILCAPGEETLWSLAKRCGSTVAAIEKANALQEDPAPDRWLLIPVI